MVIRVSRRVKPRVLRTRIRYDWAVVRAIISSEGYRKPCSFALGTLNFDPPVVGEHYFLNQRKAEACAVRFRREKWEKDFPENILRHAVARVFNKYADVTALGGSLHENRDGAGSVQSLCGIN